MFPYCHNYGLVVWGQAPQSHLNKILLLQKRALCITHFSNPRAHGVPLFVSAKILPLNLLYFEAVSNLMYDISKNSAPENICYYFIRCSSTHSRNTRPPRRKIFISSIRARTNWVILLQFFDQKYGVAFHLKYADYRELLLNKKFEMSSFKFSTPKTVMLTHPLCWIK